MTETTDTGSADGSRDENPTDDREVVSYDDVSFTDQAGFKPMIGIAAVILVSFALLIGLPMYSEPGDGELTLFTYTAILWGIIVILGGFAYEFWLMRIEGEGW